MVTNASSLGRSGVHDYILIRASAIILACYTIFLLGFVALNSSLTYEVWHGLFSALPMKVFTLLALVAILVHAWVGTWQVLTDYIHNLTLRGVLLFVVVVTVLSYLAAGILIVWGV